MAASYSMMALEHDMIGISMCNTTPKVAVYGGMSPVLGTNPLSIAVPAGRYDPLVFDAATSVLARGKILMANAEGKNLIPGAALDEYGNPTIDPQEALNGVLLPFGEHKGSGISLMIDVFERVFKYGAIRNSHSGIVF